MIFPTSPFPCKTKMGTVIDEVCVCGHLRSQHTSTFGWGHGECCVLVPDDHGRTKKLDCNCKKFAWAAHVLQP